MNYVQANFKKIGTQPPRQNNHQKLQAISKQVIYDTGIKCRTPKTTHLLFVFHVCAFPSRVSIKQANAVQLVPMPMAFAAFTAMYRLHRESLDKKAINTNTITLALPKQFGKWPITPPHPPPHVFGRRC